jgi:histone H3/H4
MAPSVPSAATPYPSKLSAKMAIAANKMYRGKGMGKGKGAAYIEAKVAKALSPAAQVLLLKSNGNGTAPPKKKSSLKSPGRLQSVHAATARQKHKRTPVQIAYKEIAHFQRSAEQLLPVAPFQKWIKSMVSKGPDGEAGSVEDADVHFSSAALVLLQEGCEQMLVQVSGDAYGLSQRAGSRHRKLRAADFQVAAKLRGWVA